MASNQIIVYGADLEWSTDGEAYTNVPEAKGIAVPQTTREYVEVTSLDSTGGYREYIKGLRDTSEITVPVGYTSAGYEQALEYADEDEPLYIRVTLRPQPNQTTGDVHEFRAFVEPSIATTDDMGAVIDFDLNFRVTGAPTFTAGTDAT